MANPGDFDREQQLIRWGDLEQDSTYWFDDDLFPDPIGKAGKAVLPVLLPALALAVALRFDPPNLLTSTLSAPAAPVPFSQSDWPNPQPKVKPPPPTWVDWRELSLVDFSIPRQSDWPNPVLKRPGTDPTFLSYITIDQTQPAIGEWTDLPPPPLRRGQDWVRGSPSVLLGVPIAVPFNQDDWPNPGPIRWPVANRTWTSTRPLGIQEIPPFNQDDWPNPLPVRRQPIIAPTPSLNQSTLAPAGGPYPGWTAHFDAATAAHLWQNTNFTGAVTDGVAVQAWDDQDGADLALLYVSGGSVIPIWRANQFNGIGSLDFTADTADYYAAKNDANTLDKPLSTFINANAYTIFLSVILTGNGTNVSPIYQNDGILRDFGQFFGLHLTTASGVSNLNAYNWDGTADSVPQPVQGWYPYVVMLRHDSGNLYISVNQGAESSIASGDTTNLVNRLEVGRGGTGSVGFAGKIGEIIFYNSALSGAAFSQSYQYMVNKWIPTVFPSGLVGSAFTDLPLRPAQNRELLTWTQAPATETFSVGAPFSQTQWPNPAPRPLPPWPIGPPNLLTSVLAPSLPPISQTQWPNPLIKGRPVQDYQQASFLSLTVGAPFSQTDWPVPRQRFVPPPPIGPPNTLIGALSSAIPFNQDDWPNPLPKFKPPPPTWVDWRELSLVDFSIPRQSDWPIPLAKRTQPGGFVASSPTVALQSIVLPNRQTEWPNPVRRALAVRGDEGFSSRAIYQPVVVGTPFTPTEWPNPRVKPIAPDLFLRYQGVVFTGLAQPFARVFVGSVIV